MGSRLKTVLDLHKDLAEELNGILAPDNGDTLIQSKWDSLTYRLKRPQILTEVEVARLRSIHNVFDILESKGIVQCGQYGKLKKILKDAQLMQCREIIQGYEAKIKDANSHNNEGALDRYTAPAMPIEHMALPGSSENTHCLLSTARAPSSNSTKTMKDIANNIKITSSVKARKTMHSIIVIVPVTRDTAWVSADYRDQRLTLINRNGNKLGESVQLCEGKGYVMDAIRFLNENILVTYTGGDKVLRMSENRQTTKIFLLDRTVYLMKSVLFIVLFKWIYTIEYFCSRYVVQTW